MSRCSSVSRQTKETRIAVTLDVDGTGQSSVRTGVGFLDHMLILWSKHGLFDLTLEADGDLYIDGHHTVEDVGIILGQAVAQALGSKEGIRRYGNAFVPMDETLAQVCVDVSGRPFLHYEAAISAPQVGTFDTELTEEFLRAFAVQAGLTLHVRILYGRNAHHMIEAIFKALGRALDEATSQDTRIKGVMSTKGSI